MIPKVRPTEMRKYSALQNSTFTQGENRRSHRQSLLEGFTWSHRGASADACAFWWDEDEAGPRISTFHMAHDRHLFLCSSRAQMSFI